MIRKLLTLCICSLLISCGGNGTGSGDGQAHETIRIAGAANMTYALDSLVGTFQRLSGHEAHTIVASSGKLTAQILQGAPFDVFLSANMNYPEEVVRAGMAEGPVIEYARGSLIMWSPVGMPLDSGLKSLLNPQIGRIAIARGKSAPYGIAALEALEADSLMEALGPRLVFGESISQVNQFLATGAADVGLTSASVLQSSEGRRGTHALVDTALYSPVRQGLVLLAYGQDHHPQASAEFVQFMLSAEAQAILVHFGYQPITRVAD